ncbi:MAG: ISKra4 family transposase [Anaerolineaceae bacterium]|nr:ISKra4 family transposase [Anaerolineaceae bacterium]
MNYNMEMIKQIAGEFAALFKTALLEQKQTSGSEPTIAEIETEMRQMFRQIGGQALGMLLSSLQNTPELEIPCGCGGTLQYQRTRPATLVSVFGRVQYERAYYAGCQCHQGKAPLDERYGLEPGAVTAGLAALLSLAGIAFSYDESPRWINEYLLFDVAENTVRAQTEQMGALQAEHEQDLIRQSQSEEYLQERERHPERIVPRLYGSMDAAKVRIEPRPKKGEAKAPHEDWRDMKVLCWYEVEPVPPAQHSTRHRAKVAREQPALRAKHLQYFSDITPAEQFGKLLWATGCERYADLCPDLVFLGDGAEWIWNLVDFHYPQAVQIVDWFHAEEHLEGVAQAAFSDPAQRIAWLEPVTQNLWDGQLERVMAACQALATSCLKAQQAATYFTNNAERMRYDRFRAAGYMIGSGTIESACKQVVTHRLDLPGAQWEVDGAVQTAKARCAWLSGDWHDLCQRRAALPLAV